LRQAYDYWQNQPDNYLAPTGTGFYTRYAIVCFSKREQKTLFGEAEQRKSLNCRRRRTGHPVEGGLLNAIQLPPQNFARSESATETKTALVETTRSLLHIALARRILLTSHAKIGISTATGLSLPPDAL